MILRYETLFVQLLLITLIEGQRLPDAVVMASSRASLALREGESVVFTCSLDYTRTGGDSMLWYRSQGVVKEMIGSRMIRAREFSNERYLFDLIDSSPTTATYQLTINSLRLEDSATIECSALSSRKASWPLIVCIDPESDSCRCMVKVGWSSPDCFKTFQYTRSQYKGYRIAVIILAIVLFLLFVLCVCQTIYVVRECFLRVRYFKDQTEASEPLSPRVNVPPMDHVPVQASALRNRRQGAEQAMVPSGNVRFVEGLPNTGIRVSGGSIYPAAPQGPQRVGPTGVLMSPGHLDAAHGYFESGQGYQSPSIVPYGNSIDRSAHSLAPSGDIYRSTGNLYSHNQPGISTGYNPVENSNVYNQVERPPPIQYNSANASNVPPPNYNELLGGYTDQMVANNLNDSRVPQEEHKLSEILYSSTADLAQGSAVYIDPGSTSV